MAASGAYRPRIRDAGLAHRLQVAKAVIGDEVMASALIDRLLHHRHIVNIRGKSYRMRKFRESLWRSEGGRRTAPRAGDIMTARRSG